MSLERLCQPVHLASTSSCEIDEGKWQPIHPADISRYERPTDQIASRSPFGRRIPRI